MHPDATRWNARYLAADESLVALADRLPDSGRALDIACGTGGNLIWLAGRGWWTLGLDVSIEALRLARAHARRTRVSTNWVVADAARSPLLEGRFDLVLVTRFLDRALFPWLQRLIAPGGLLFYCTFNERHLERHPSFNARFVLESGELQRAFHTLKRIEDGERDTSSWLLARRRGRPQRGAVTRC